MFDKYNTAQDWLQDHASEWWHDLLNIITDNNKGTATITQEQLAYTIIVLFALLIAHVLIAVSMIRRRPILLLDKSLLSREIGYSILWGMTLYVFYAQIAISIYIRNAVYTILFISAVLVSISLIRENTLSNEEIEEERQEYLERKNRNGNTSKG